VPEQLGADAASSAAPAYAYLQKLRPGPLRAYVFGSLFVQDGNNPECIFIRAIVISVEQSSSRVKGADSVPKPPLVAGDASVQFAVLDFGQPLRERPYPDS
jgi:hypothetical protein